MNARELIQHQRRVAAWALQDKRAKELAARQVILDAQARIEEILRANSTDATGALQEDLPSAARQPSLLQKYQQLIRAPPASKEGVEIRK